MYHRGKYQTATPRPVRMVQNESCNSLSKVSRFETIRRTHAKVDISDCVKKGRPREAAVENLTDRLVLFFFKDGVRYALLVSAARQRLSTLQECKELVPATSEVAGRTLCSDP